MRITLAHAMGTCFGVERAIEMAMRPEFVGRLTIIGQLVHNPQVIERLREHGVRIITWDEVDTITTEAVMITAHGAPDERIAALRARGLVVHDASCPLVQRLHATARQLEDEGYYPVIVGQRDHVEVQGVIGNLRDCAVVAGPDDLDQVRGHARIGVVSQTTNRIEPVTAVVAAIGALPGVREVRFIDTICKPVKDRQAAIAELLSHDIDIGVVIGGRNSSNTRKLFDMISGQGIECRHVERPEELRQDWFIGKHHAGLTAGTSTPQDVIAAVHDRLLAMAQGLEDG